MNKKNVLLSLLPFAGLLATPLAAISCAKEDAIEINSGFSADNPQGRALTRVVEEYNKWIKENQKGKDGYLPVRITVATNGYDTTGLSSVLTAGNNKNLRNIYVNYPATAALLKRYGKNLAINKELYDSFGIAEIFKKNANKLIAGNTNDDVWTVPFARSSEMNSINRPVLGKMLSELKANYGLKIDENAQELQKILKEWEGTATNNVSSKEKAAIDKIWKSNSIDVVYKTEDAKTNAKAKVTEKVQILNKDGAALTDEVFKDYNLLFAMINAMKLMYPLRDAQGLFIAGFDSVPNALNVMTSSLTNGKPEEGYIKRNDNGTYDYELFMKNGTAQYNFFKNISKEFIEAINLRSISIGGAGKYSSNDLVNHKIAMSIGSTAGYTHTFKSTTRKIYTYTIPNTTIEIQPGRGKNTGMYVDSVENKGNLLLKFTANNGRNINNLLKTTATKEEVGKYNAQIASAEAQTKLEGASIAKGDLIIASSDFTKEDGDVVKYKGTVVPDAAYLGKIIKGSESEYYLLKKSTSFKFEIKEVKDSRVKTEETLQKEEVDSFKAPGKFSIDGKQGVYAVWEQGPSLIPVTKGAKVDAATIKFITWLYTHTLSEINMGKLDKNDETSPDIVYTNVKPIEAFNRFGNYITPTTEYLNHNENDDAIRELNPALRLAFDQFKAAQTDPTNNVISGDIPTALANPWRKDVTSALQGLQNDATSKTITFDNFITAVSRTFTGK